MRHKQKYLTDLNTKYFWAPYFRGFYYFTVAIIHQCDQSYDIRQNKVAAQGSGWLEDKVLMKLILSPWESQAGGEQHFEEQKEHFSLQYWLQGTEHTGAAGAPSSAEEIKRNINITKGKDSHCD